ncbi:MAG: antibiotic biosynthesis monooxygenase [Nevskia sp.]|nr:antibiotic biosynthesis monooxygenase [Nevskia sp.]
MSSTSVRVVARLIAKPDKVEAFKALMSGIVDPTRKESGCIRYELLQNQADPTDFTFVEEWASKAALDAHMQTPHITGALGKAGEMLGGAPDIRFYTTVR